MDKSRTLLVALTLFIGCREPSAPEQALAGYIHTVREHRCAEAMIFLSARTRHAVESLIERPQHPEAPVPIEHYYCYDLMFENCKVEKMTLIDQSADKAKVSIPCGRTQDSILPGLTSIFLKYEPRVNELVHEDGKWRVELPMSIRIIELREERDRARDVAIREMERRRQADPTSRSGPGR
jgi:hypothetical protein